MKSIRRSISFQSLALLLVCVALFFVADANALTVDVYSGYTGGSGDGSPYSGPVGSFTSPDVMFATNTGYAWHPFGLSSFGADIKGNLNVAANGTYTFSLNSDDGSSLFIDGIQIINNGGGHTPSTISSSDLLTAGNHSFEVRFFEDFGGPSGVDLALPGGVSYVPEPATLLLFGAGLAGIAAFRKRMKRS